MANVKIRLKDDGPIGSCPEGALAFWEAKGYKTVDDDAAAPEAPAPTDTAEVPTTPASAPAKGADATASGDADSTENKPTRGGRSAS